MTARIELTGIEKRFGAVAANAGVSLRADAGEIHALLGENGAGKSTLVKMIAGLLRPDAGTIAIDGAEQPALTPDTARRLGIVTVHQHFSLFEAMSVLENVALGLPRARADSALAAQIEAIGDEYGLPISVRKPVWALSAGERQVIEIVRCLLQSPRLLMMDEPTSVLTPPEVERLFRAIRQVAEGGCTVLYISHKLEEIRALCHRATVLRSGRVVASCTPADESAAGLAQMMIGAVPDVAPRTAGTPGPVRLAVRGLTQPADRLHGTTLRDIWLEVRAGEIVGVAGVAGNGQAELFAALSGERRTADETVVIDGQLAGRAGPMARRRMGLCALPEDRLGHSAAPGFDLVENGLLTARERMGLARRGTLRRARATAFAQRVIERFGVRTAGVQARAGSLSGGNLQKFVVGREVSQQPGVLVIAQPSWGVDAGATADIHRALFDLAASGAAVLVISQDLDELRTISDRLFVIAGGTVRSAGSAADAGPERIGLLMAGVVDAA